MDSCQLGRCCFLLEALPGGLVLLVLPLLLLVADAAAAAFCLSELTSLDSRWIPCRGQHSSGRGDVAHSIVTICDAAWQTTHAGCGQFLCLLA
jgi:hypothetical protein